MLFWSASAILAIMAAYAVLHPLLRPTQIAPPEGEADLQVYRDQLAEVDRDLAKGLIAEADAERLRLEISRRILEADKMAGADRSGDAARVLTLAAGGIAALVILAGTAAVYWQIGGNGTPDLPLTLRKDIMAEQRANRPSQAEAEAKVGDATDLFTAAEEPYRILVAELRDTVANRPDDITGHALLAQHEARLGFFAAAARAQTRVIELKGASATAEDQASLAELLILAAGGYVSPKAETALGRAIKLDPTNPQARYYSGLALVQSGRPDITLGLWRGLLAEGPEDAPWIQPIREQIGDVARMAGTNPGELPGPSAEQMKDAEEMSDDDRQAMIQGMVAQLSERLATDGGTAEEWARLIRAYGVLGETDRARAIWQEAQSNFADQADALAAIRAAASAAGVAAGDAE